LRLVDEHCSKLRSKRGSNDLPAAIAARDLLLEATAANSDRHRYRRSIHPEGEQVRSPYMAFWLQLDNAYWAAPIAARSPGHLYTDFL
jgi:hypothetical protein